VFSLESSVRLTYLLDEGAVVCKDIKQLQDCDVLVDGLFGYGFRPPAGEAYATLINEMNALSLPWLALTCLLDFLLKAWWKNLSYRRNSQFFWFTEG